ncbi:MAG TPA: hypothetical protein VMT55_05925 [Candidatus Sulfotelmatobacter sp.]|nr:hypothetical protein [Candidatus Sulfotelmatobacter sp.]
MKIVLYFICLAVGQTVIAARLGFLGVYPDLWLVSAVAFAVLSGRGEATFFSGAAGFLQDLLAAGPYVNTIVKLAVANVVSSVKEEFMGDEYSFTAGMVALFVPLLLVLRALLFLLFFGRPFGLPALLFQMAGQTAYSLLFVPLIFPLVKTLTDGDQEI